MIIFLWLPQCLQIIIQFICFSQMWFDESIYEFSNNMLMNSAEHSKLSTIASSLLTFNYLLNRDLIFFLTNSSFQTNNWRSRSFTFSFFLVDYDPSNSSMSHFNLITKIFWCVPKRLKTQLIFKEHFIERNSLK